MQAEKLSITNEQIYKYLALHRVVSKICKQFGWDTRTFKKKLLKKSSAAMKMAALNEYKRLKQKERDELERVLSINDVTKEKGDYEYLIEENERLLNEEKSKKS